MTDTKTEAKPAKTADPEVKGANDAVTEDKYKFGTATETVVGDPTGEVTNRPNGEGTMQTEPRAEDYPTQARVLPPAEQLNPRAATAVGVLAGRDDDQKAIDDGIKLHEKATAAAVEGAQDIADMKRELDKKIAEVAAG